MQALLLPRRFCGLQHKIRQAREIIRLQWQGPIPFIGQ
jgi:hypothetical protein